MLIDAKTPQEERANMLSHLLGTLLAVGGIAPMIVFAAKYSAVAVVSVSIFCASQIVMFLMSTLYHGLPAGKAKRVFEVMDHSAIYIFIAGTYTPMCLLTLGGAWGWSIFGVSWGLALMGVVFKIFSTGKFALFSTMMYVAMGWLVVIAFKPLLQHVGTAGLFWLVAGGLMYTIGTIFYMNQTIRYTHAIWHAFVLAGAAAHYVFVWTQIAQIPH